MPRAAMALTQQVFTKALAKPKFQRFIEMLGLRDESQPEGERRKERTGGKGV